MWKLDETDVARRFRTNAEGKPCHNDVISESNPDGILENPSMIFQLDIRPRRTQRAADTPMTNNGKRSFTIQINGLRNSFFLWDG